MNNPNILSTSNNIMKVEAKDIPRAHNNQPEVETLITDLATKKNKYSLLKLLYLGFLAGIFISISGIAAITGAGGISVPIREANPAIPKLLNGALFPVGLMLIILFGGDLFTGNTMYMAVAWLHGRVSTLGLLKNWILVFITNFIGCLAGAYFFAYLTDIWSNPIYVLYLTKMVEAKANQTILQTFLRGIPANGLVCLAIYLGIVARETVGKIVGIWWPIFIFALVGFDHSIANIFYFCAGTLFGANITASQFAINITFASLGNIIGGSLLVGWSQVYLYNWDEVDVRSHFKVFPGLNKQGGIIIDNTNNGNINKDETVAEIELETLPGASTSKTSSKFFL